MRLNRGYYIERLQANLHPNPDERKLVGTEANFEIGDANLDENNETITTSCNLNLDLLDPDVIENQEIDGEPTYGEIEIEFMVRISGDFEYLAEQADIWNNDGYTEIDLEMIDAVETGILPSILGPIEQLTGNAFEGIIPRIRFTPPSDQ